MCGCLTCVSLGTWPTAQSYALTGSQTSGPLVHRPALNQLSYTSQVNMSYDKVSYYPGCTQFMKFISWKHDTWQGKQTGSIFFHSLQVEISVVYTLEQWENMRNDSSENGQGRRHTAVVISIH